MLADAGFPPRAIEGKISDNVTRVLRLDSSTHAIKVISYEHSEVHSGGHFYINHSATSKNDGETIVVYFKTPNTAKWLHLIMRWSSGGAAYAYIRETPTVTANTGTNGQDVINNNRNSTTVSAVVDNATSPATGKFCKDPTITGAGTTIWQDYSGAAKSDSGSGQRDQEIILKQNTAYNFIVESDAAGISLNLNLEWYSHEDKN